MSTMTISLPLHIAKLVNTEAKKKGFATRSEFIRDLLRRYFYASPAISVFEPKPLSEVKKEMMSTGKYNQKFVTSVVKGLSKSSLYAD